jgi:hypothetical protein
MSKNTVFGLIALTCLMAANADAQSETRSCCGPSKHPVRITARHIEGKGVGYNQGYTTLEGFFTTEEPWGDSWIPFLDLRGHVFDNGKMAANAGVGFRYLASSRILGANAYYDYRHTAHRDYNQVSLGFESLGEIWDFRVNGYLPVGHTRSSWYNPQFAKFVGHTLFVSRKREFAMKGANAEVGAHVNNFEHVPIYFAAGPYYLQGQGKTAWGGELRVAIDIYEYVRLEGNTSYDNVFKWIGQGQISVNIPLGRKRQVKRGKSCSCDTALALSDRALQRVDRNEIIPVDTKRRDFDPSLPYSFIFVNNKSSSNGTIESPYPTLQQAQANSSPGDVIYVFEGNGSAYDVTSLGTNGFLMQNNQKLWGSGTKHKISTRFGTITLPALSKNMPTVNSSFAGGNVVAMANNCEVSGMHIIGANLFSGINAQNVNGNINHNWVQVSSSSTNCAGIYADNTGSGGVTVTISKNTLSDISSIFGNAYGVSATNTGAGSMTAYVEANTMTGISTPVDGSYAVGCYTQLNSGSTGSLAATVTGNEMSNISVSGGVMFGITAESAGVVAYNEGTGSLTALVQGNTIFNISSTGMQATPNGVDAENLTGSAMTVTIAYNTISGCSSVNGSSLYGFFIGNEAGEMSATITGNLISDLSGTAPSIGVAGYYVLSNGGNMSVSDTGNSTFNLSATGSSASTCGIQAYNNGANLLTLSIADSQFVNLSCNGTGSNTIGVLPENSGSGNMTATITDCLISNLTASGSTTESVGVYASNTNSGNLTLGVVNTQISNLSATDNGSTGIAALSNGGSGNVTATISYNAISQLTSSAAADVNGIIVGDQSSGNVTATITGNVISGITSSVTGANSLGIQIENLGIGLPTNMTVEMMNNQFSNILGPPASSWAIYASQFNANGGNMTVSAIGNTLLNIPTIPFAGIEIDNDANPSNLCVTLIDNDMVPAPINLNNLAASNYLLYSIGNDPAPTITGPITPISSPCP